MHNLKSGFLKLPQTLDEYFLKAEKIQKTILKKQKGDGIIIFLSRERLNFPKQHLLKLTHCENVSLFTVIKFPSGTYSYRFLANNQSARGKNS